MIHVLRLCIYPFVGHSGPEFNLKTLHPFPRATHSDSAAQLFGLSAGKIRHHHCDLQQLFLKERNAQGPSQYRLKQRVGISDGLAAYHSVERPLTRMKRKRGLTNRQRATTSLTFSERLMSKVFSWLQ